MFYGESRPRTLSTYRAMDRESVPARGKYAGYDRGLSEHGNAGELGRFSQDAAAAEIRKELRRRDCVTYRPVKNTFRPLSIVAFFFFFRLILSDTLCRLTR